MIERALLLQGAGFSLAFRAILVPTDPPPDTTPPPRSNGYPVAGCPPQPIQPVEDLRDAVATPDWYSSRWKVETFHKILKSGCRAAEESNLRTPERLTNLPAVYGILARRVFWLCMVNRAAPDAPAGLVFTKTELDFLDRIVKNLTPAPVKTIPHYLTAVARLGGYLAWGGDGPPGNMVLWRGLSRLTDIDLGYILASPSRGVIERFAGGLLFFSMLSVRLR